MPGKMSAAAAVASATCRECSSRPRAVGVVVVLGGERAAKRAAGARPAAEQRAPSARRDADREVPAMCASSWRSSSATGRCGPVEQSLPVDLERDHERLDGDLRAVTWVLGERADDPHRISGGRAVAAAFSTPSQTTAGDDAGSISQREPQVVRSGPRLAELAVTDEQYLVDGVAVLEVADVADLAFGPRGVPRSRSRRTGRVPDLGPVKSLTGGANRGMLERRAALGSGAVSIRRPRPVR